MGRRLYQLGLSCLVLGLVTILLAALHGDDGRKMRPGSAGLVQLASLHTPPWLNVSSGNDIMVFIHVQKTGGSSFLAHLTTAQTHEGHPLCAPPNPMLRNSLNRKKDFAVCPLKKSEFESSELPEMWLASERTYGWICGVHPFIFEMQSCLNAYIIDKYGIKTRNFHFITLLRHPVLRYISEYLHVTRGATWMNRRVCDGHSMEGVMPPCYPGYYAGEPWKNVTFDKFLRCQSNWANNRQTITFANISAVHCLDSRGLSRSDRDYILLESAKTSLKDMPFFGISEYFLESCILFEKQFKLKFKSPCTQKSFKKLHSASLVSNTWSNRALHNSIVLTNHLDMQLYNFALTLFTTRLAKYNISIDKNKVDNEIQEFHRRENLKRSASSF